MANKAGCRAGCLSVGGSVFIGALIPALLFAFHSGERPFHGPTIEDGIVNFLQNTAGIFMMGLFYAGPGAAIIALIVYVRLSPIKNNVELVNKAHLWRGLKMGACVSFLNVPAYLSVMLLPPVDIWILAFLRMAVLFSVTGAVCGFWIALQTWREQHPEKPLVRYSLQSMMIGVLIFGAVLALFAPFKK